MPQARLSENAAEQARAQDGTVADTVDEWREKAAVLDRLRYIDQGSGEAHMLDMNHQDEPIARCGAIPRGQPAVLTAKDVGPHDFEQCEVCFDE